jgi:hypothetical protein
LQRIPLLIVDEVGYIPFDPQAANLMFMLVSRRYERARQAARPIRSRFRTGRAGRRGRRGSPTRAQVYLAGAGRAEQDDVLLVGGEVELAEV